MIRLRVRGSKSWLDPTSQFALSMMLAHKLVDRCRGKRGVFVTLTYRRDEFEDPCDLYRKTGEQQHVPLFLRKVSRYLGVSLKGKWICKLEFQKGGWVHWHIIILGVKKIAHAELNNMWGRGHVWINRLSPNRIKYCCKYVCKGGEVPSWLLAEPTRSVKIIRVSPGFWGDATASRKGDAIEPMYQPFKNARVPMFKAIGQRIEDCKNQLVARDEGDNFRQVVADFALLLVALMQHGHAVIGNDRGWVVVDCDWDSLDRIATAVTRPGAAAATRGGGPRRHMTE